MTGSTAVTSPLAGVIANPATSSSVTSTLAVYPDLQVQDLTLSPTSGLVSGGTLHIAWSDVNVGDADAAADYWRDRVSVIRNGVEVHSAYVSHYASLDGILTGQGGTLSRSYDYTLPEGDAGVGEYQVTVTVDYYNQQCEDNLGDTGENNNSATSAIVTAALSLYSDLQVEEVSVPTSAQAGGTASILWRVRNLGDAAADAGQWRDAIYLSTDSLLDGGDVLLDEVIHSGGLESGASYSAQADVLLPYDTPVGSYRRILVVTDAGGSVFEGAGEDNNTKASDDSLVIVNPDLRPVSVTVDPQSVLSSESVMVSWQVNNTGIGEALGAWIDRIYLSRDGVLDSGDVLLGELAHTGPLAVDAAYDAQLQVALPLGAAGDYSILVKSDAADSVMEPGAEDNNTGSAALFVTRAPYADLAVGEVRAVPVNPYNGMLDVIIGDPAQVAVTWTVGNVGTGVGLTTAWTDTVIVSEDAVLGDADDLVLGQYREGPLAAGDSYTRSQAFLLPAYFTGRFHLFVVADSDGEVFENESEANNSGEVYPFDVMTTPYADMQVTEAAVAGSAMSGGSVQVSWTIGNFGIGPTSTDVCQAPDATSNRCSSWIFALCA